MGLKNIGCPYITPLVLAAVRTILPPWVMLLENVFTPGYTDASGIGIAVSRKALEVG